MNEHPSCLALDRARLGDRSAEVAAHLNGCASCRAYVEAQVDERVPAWARALETNRRPDRGRWLALSGWPVGAAIAVAAAVVLWIQVGSNQDPRAPYVGVKAATPSVEVFLRRQSRVVPWSGQALQAGDRIQLRVASAHFGQVSVVAKSPDGFVTLHRQAIPASERSATVSLSRSFRVDSSSGDHSLVVLMSRAPVAPEILQQPPDSSTADVWVKWLHFEEELSHE